MPTNKYRQCKKNKKTQVPNNVLYEGIDPVFSLFPQNGWKEDEHFFYNFLGGRISKDYFFKRKQEETKLGILQKPFWEGLLWTSKSPKYACSEDYFEWRDMLCSVANASGTYNFLKLGSYVGRWEANAALANHFYKRLKSRIISVDPCFLSEIQRTMKDNGTNDFEELTHEIITKYAVREPSSDNEISLKELIEKFNGEVIDFVDIDIQGSEKWLIKPCEDLFNKTVKRVHIGTHDNTIDNVLYELFISMGWEIVTRMRKGTYRKHPQGWILVDDGILSCVNPSIK